MFIVICLKVLLHSETNIYFLFENEGLGGLPLNTLVLQTTFIKYKTTKIHDTDPKPANRVF